METILYSQARNNLRKLIDKVCIDYDEFLINTKDNKSAVLLSYEEYKGLKETLYLLSTKTNRDRLLDAVEEIEKGNFTQRELIE